MSDRWRKKPVEIEARKINTLDYDGLTDVIKWVNDNDGVAWAIGEEDGDGQAVIAISTLEGVMSGYDGDYVIKGVRGEFYACRGDIFLETYEPADD